MSDDQDNEMFTKGSCFPRHLIVEGRLVQDIFRNDARPQEKIHAAQERSANDILDDLVSALRTERNIPKCDEALLKSAVIAAQSEKPLKDSPELFVSISGFVERLFVEQTLIRNQQLSVEDLGFLVSDYEKIEYRTKVCGKIRDYVFVNETRSGHLAVELIQEEFCTRQAFLDCKPDRVTTYH
ncbi:MAG: hypothetical protein ACR2Q4_17460, partial [Geminicoccaceae bacterium]